MDYTQNHEGGKKRRRRKKIYQVPKDENEEWEIKKKGKKRQLPA